MQGSRTSIDSVRRAQEYLSGTGACFATDYFGSQKPNSDGRDSMAESGLGGEHPTVPAPRASLPDAQSASDDKFHMLVLLSYEQPFSTRSAAATRTARASISVDEWQPAFITLGPTPPDGPSTGSSTDASRRNLPDVAIEIQSQGRQPRPTVRYPPRGMELGPSPSRDIPSGDDGHALHRPHRMTRRYESPGDTGMPGGGLLQPATTQPPAHSVHGGHQAGLGVAEAPFKLGRTPAGDDMVGQLY